MLKIENVAATCELLNCNGKRRNKEQKHAIYVQRTKLRHDRQDFRQ